MPALCWMLRKPNYAWNYAGIIFSPLLKRLDLLQRVHHFLYKPSFFQQLSSSWWMAWLSTLHPFTQVTSRCLTKFAECTLTINIILKPWKVFLPLFLIFPAAATCSTILQSLLQEFWFTNTGFLSWRNFYLFFTATITTTATRRGWCRWFTGASKVRSNIHINENSLLNY